QANTLGRHRAGTAALNNSRKTFGLHHRPVYCFTRSGHARSAAGGSGEYLGQLDEIAEGIAKEGQAPADRWQLERLGHDGDAARAERLDGRVDAGHVQAEMMVAGPLQAVAEVGIGTNVLRGRIAAAQDLDIEVVVRRGRDIGKLLVGVVPLGDDAKV